LIATELDFERFFNYSNKNLWCHMHIFDTIWTDIFTFYSKKWYFKCYFVWGRKTIVKCDVISCFGAFGKVVRLETDPCLSCMLAQSWWCDRWVLQWMNLICLVFSVSRIVSVWWWCDCGIGNAAELPCLPIWLRNRLYVFITNSVWFMSLYKFRSVICNIYP
jgi:hypothetical protein